MRKRIAVVVAHPDDEVLACGGAIAAHHDAGDSVDVLITATGLTSRQGQAHDISALRREADAAAGILGVTNIRFLDFPDNAMDSVPLIDVVQTVEAFLEEVQPTTIYTHFSNDLNVDHRIVSAAVATACRPVPGQAVKNIYACEVNSSTEWAFGSNQPAFQPTDYLDISDQLERKLAALNAYGGEIRDWPHPRSREGLRILAQWRGTQVGLEAAEAFICVRRILHSPHE